MLTIISGLALVQAGQASKSVSDFETALRLRPEDVGYRTNLGTAYLQQADFDTAIAQFQTALKSAPQDATLHYNLGLALKLKDQLPEALAEFHKAEQLDPAQPDVHYTLGVTLWQQAIRRFRTGVSAAIASRADYAEAHSTLSGSQTAGKIARGGYGPAGAIRLQPDFAGAHTTLAAVLRGLGDNEGAAAEARAGQQIGNEKTGQQAALLATSSASACSMPATWTEPLFSFAPPLVPVRTMPPLTTSLGLPCVARATRNNRLKNFRGLPNWILSFCLPHHEAKLDYLPSPLRTATISQLHRHAACHLHVKHDFEGPHFTAGPDL